MLSSCICLHLGTKLQWENIFFTSALSNAYLATGGRPFKRVVNCYGSQWQDIFEKFQAIGVTFHARSLDPIIGPAV